RRRGGGPDRPPLRHPDRAGHPAPDVDPHQPERRLPGDAARPRHRPGPHHQLRHVLPGQQRPGREEPLLRLRPRQRRRLADPGVALLLGPTGVAVAWFACVALLMALALPGGRRWLSPAACHRLERGLDQIVKATAVTTGLVLSSGLYLTLKQTAYKTPLSSRA